MDNYQPTSNGVVERVPFGTIQHNLSCLEPTTSEVGHLYAAYLAETMSICFLKKWVHQANDPEIHLILQQALDVSTERVRIMETLFNSTNYPIPEGFGEKDVNVNTPRLFSDSLACLYTRVTQKMVMYHYTGAATSSYRSDFRNFYSDSVKSSDEIHRRATETLLAKGILLKHPSISPPTTNEKVQGKDYFGSYFRVFDNHRPLNAAEIGHIYTLMEIKHLIRALNLGYCQVVKLEKIKDFLLKAREIADKQLEVLESLLNEQSIPSPLLSEILVTDSKESGFSDRLILTHSTSVTAYILTAYGLALPNILRKDIDSIMLKFISEVLGLAKDGAELMVKLSWLEKIPETADRKKLMQ